MPTVCTVALPSAKLNAFADRTPEWPSSPGLIIAKRVAPILGVRLALAALAERRASDALWFGTAPAARDFLRDAERHTLAALRIVESSLSIETAALAADLAYRAACYGTQASTV